ncbi:MAG: ATP-binding cassette domain-containing protein, partial [Campylobacter sp.]|nr:ATP-binding cassette domain-containing protein [Campylobacter sp.]
MITIDCKKKISEDFAIDAKLEIKKGSFVCLYGRSGSGKTTLLRIIAGFLPADSGFLKDGDRVLQEGKDFMSAGKRRIGFLFQDYALFENMSVLGNLLFAKNDLKRARDLLELLELSSHASAGVGGLSGGQKQR